MEIWESKLIEELNIIIRLNVTRMGKIIHSLDGQNQQKWIDTLKEEIHETCTLYVEEATFFVAIQYLQESCSKLCGLLQIDTPLYDSKSLTLYEEKKLLEKHVKEYEEEIEDKQNRFKEMTIKQVSLCRLLEKVPMIFVEKTVPTNTELNNLSIEINKLESEWQEIKNKFREIKRNIKNILQELDIEIDKEFCQIFISNNNTSINKDNLQRLINYYKMLEQQQNQEEQKQLESLEKVINDLYDTCHIAIPERLITQNIYNHTLIEIQEEISNLRNYWKENEKTFLLFENYNKYWMKLSKFVEECYKHNNVARKIIPLKNFCEQVYKTEERLISHVIQYETKHAKPFTTFGQAVPDVIAKLHDSFGKYTITEISDKTTLSSIILQYKDVVKEPHSQFVSQEIANYDAKSCDFNTPSNENVVKEKTGSVREDSPLIIEKKMTVEEPSDTQANMIILPLRSNEYSQSNNNLLSSTVSRENNINVNINNQDAPIQVSIFLNTPSSSGTTLKIGKSKNYSKYKTGKKIRYRPILPKNQNIFKPKTIEVIRNLLTELDLK